MSSDLNFPQFDPSKPSIPISYPIKTLEDLDSRSYFDSFHFPFNKSSVPIPDWAVELPDRRRLLVCHDMQGGYGEDKWVQGGEDGDAYGVWHWGLVDVFVYFSHCLVSLPPPGWVNAAHKHGVKVLGTFLAEWEEGRKICNKLLETEESARKYAERLAELAMALGFDGWLINMEINLDVGQIANLKEFVSHLTKIMHLSLPGSLVIWYDAITVHGQLKWQDQLNENNKPFFDICDGIFVNYTWKNHYPKLSASVSGNRKHDVYMGIDVFGRNTFGGGQWNTSVALELLKNEDVSAALFAPGWVYETKQPPDFETAQNSWWNLVEKSWGLMNYYPKMLPFYSNFDKGHGYHISVEGRKLKDTPWNNLSCQEFQPCLEFTNDPTETIQVLIDVKEASYSGGGNITFRGFVEDHAYFSKRIFRAELDLGDQPLHVTYSVKSNKETLLGLSLEFSSSQNEKTRVLIAPTGANQLSNSFNIVITTHQLSKPETDPEWILHNATIRMNNHVLTEIQAVCYRLQPEHEESRSKPSAFSQDNYESRSPAKYFAILGHIAMKSSEENSAFPPSDAWLVEAQNISVSSATLESKIVSVKLIWKLKDGTGFSFPKYNIYVEELGKQDEGNPGGRVKGACTYFGMAKIAAFYISGLPVLPNTHSLRFIIQVCDSLGASQKLDDSPCFDLDIEGELYLIFRGD
ncbi:Cytosolic endo-beta-N-acetylglucosaminidase 1 [Euphorbia peplus]|nr:Cytosolic endo-beta-N-acetylglucosaminidase 1 [Euphorbia peplus]